MGDVNLAPGWWPLFVFMLLLTRVLTVPCGLTLHFGRTVLAKSTGREWVY